MADKSLEALVVKVVKKVIRKEIKAIKQYSLPIVSTQINQELQSFPETLETEDHIQTTAEIFENIYASNTVNFPAKEDLELDRKLRKIKFK
jgi:flagellar biosynthesis/type III secretory pathway protein FliH